MEKQKKILCEDMGATTYNYLKYWMPILKQQYFKYKILNEIDAIIELRNSIWKNWKLTKEQKLKILKEVEGKK